MSIHKRRSFPGSILFAVALLFTFSFIQAAPAHAASTHSTARAASAAPAVDISCPPTQSQGADNDWVKVIEYWLNNLDENGFINFSTFPLAADGSFGPNTNTAVVQFQQELNLKGDGIVGPLTWSAMGFCNHFASGYTYGGNNCPPIQQGSGLKGDGVGPLTWSMMGFCSVGTAHFASGYTYDRNNCPPTESEGANDTFVNAIQHLVNMDAYDNLISTTSPESNWYPLR